MWLCPATRLATAAGGGNPDGDFESTGAGTAVGTLAAADRALIEFSAPGDQVLVAAPVNAPSLNGLVGQVRELARAAGRVPHGLGQEPVGLADLVMVIAEPSAGVEVARAGVPMPRPGGVLVALTHTAQAGGRLVDPTWSIVAAARRGGARYAAHIIAVHTTARAVIDAARPIQARADTTPPTPPVEPAPPAELSAPPPWHSEVLVFHRPRPAGGAR